MPLVVLATITFAVAVLPVLIQRQLLQPEQPVPILQNIPATNRFFVRSFSTATATGVTHRMQYATVIGTRFIAPIVSQIPSKTTATTTAALRIVRRKTSTTAITAHTHRLLHSSPNIRTCCCCCYGVVEPPHSSLILRQQSHRVVSLRRSRLFSSTIDRIMNDEMVNNPNHSSSSNSNSNSNNINDLRGGASSSSVSTNNEASKQLKNYTEYELWVRRLYATNLFHPVKLGLDNMVQLHAAIGNPMDQTKNICVVHIAGTNGKGSVALKIAKTLQYAGLKVGLFCSPHVSSFRERMQINDALISEEEVVQLLPHLYELCQTHDIPATFFEITTLLAFRYFALHKVDVVVLETGLGGRLDATNVVQHPALSIITSIGLEHTRILGDTIELIALEKGGIIKKDCPVLVGPNVPHSTLRQCAQEKGASQYYTCEDVFRNGNHSDMTLTIGDTNVDYDYENSCIARAAIMLLQQSHSHLFQNGVVSDDIIHRGISHRPPCRFEIVQYCRTGTNNPQQDGNEKTMTIILDVAHNPPAMDYLLYKLQSTYPNRSFRIVVGMSADKDMKLCATSLKQIVQNDISRIHLVEAAHPRAAKLEDMWKADPELQQYATYDIHNRTITQQILTALNAMQHPNDNEKDDILVICGSVFLMAEAREALGFDEPRDSPYIAELAGAGVRHNQENFGNRTL